MTVNETKEENEGSFAGPPIDKNRTSEDKNLSDATPSLKEVTTPKKEEYEDKSIKLVYPTNHLRGFEELRKATRLHGKEYILILKAIWYGLLSCRNSKVKLKLNQVETDGRIHLLIPLKSGKGKKELKRVIKAVMGGIGKAVDEPTSLHPEQLVGKTIKKNRRGETEYENIEGYFSRDYLIIDEGRTLLTSNDLIYTESRRYLRLALDPYPHNKITKRPVDIPFGEELEYTPYMGCSIFTQPYYFEEDFATGGDLRRFIVPYVNMSGIDRTEAYKNRILEINDSDDSLNNFILFLKSIESPDCYRITTEGKIVFLKVFDALVKRGFSYSTKIRNFVDLFDFTIQDLLLKMSYVQALQVGSDEITDNHISLAFIDLFEFLEHLYLFVEAKIHGRIDYDEEWNGATDKDKELLVWLHDKGASSLENSTVSIGEYEEKIQEVFEVQLRQSINIKRKHERNNWIKSKKGAHKSWVWLGFTPHSRPARGEMQTEDFEKFYLERIKNLPNCITLDAPLENPQVSKNYNPDHEEESEGLTEDKNQWPDKDIEIAVYQFHDEEAMAILEQRILEIEKRKNKDEGG